MKHLAVIQSEFIKEARKWDDLSYEDQKGYLKRHPKSKRKITAKPEGSVKSNRQIRHEQPNQKIVHDLNVGKVSPSNEWGTSLVSYIKGPTKKDIVNIFGNPNSKDEKYGDIWVVRIGQITATIYGGEDNGIWHIGGFPRIKDNIKSNFKKLFPEAIMSESYFDLAN